MTFIAHLYFLDTGIIMGMVIAMTLWIQIRSYHEQAQNTAYNEQLLTLRNDIYEKYEKNFFV